MEMEEVVAVTEKLTGWIEVICGSMFSGKTEELIRRLRRAQIAKQRVSIFKPMIDVRYSEDRLVSHNLQKIPSQVVKNAEDILKNACALDEKSIIIATYALCGFANFSSIWIQIGGIGALAPNRRADLSKVALKAMFGDAIASWITACIAGILF